MGASLYFDTFESTCEQDLISDLIEEAICIYGHNVYYCPRTVINRDAIFVEPEFEQFDSAHLVEMYIKNADGYEGEGEFLSRFGVEIRHQMTLTIAIKTFDDEVGLWTSQVRPDEGDMIYIPMLKSLYQVRFVEPHATFYQLGKLQSYDLICELIEYNNQVFNTGITEIDLKYNVFTTDSNAYYLLDENGAVILDENGQPLFESEYDIDLIDLTAQNEEIQTEADLILDFTDEDPFSEGGRF
jgi:hypothetical protein